MPFIFFLTVFTSAVIFQGTVLSIWKHIFFLILPIALLFGITQAYGRTNGENFWLH